MVARDGFLLGRIDQWAADHTCATGGAGPLVLEPLTYTCIAVRMSTHVPIEKLVRSHEMNDEDLRHGMGLNIEANPAFVQLGVALGRGPFRACVELVFGEREITWCPVSGASACHFLAGANAKAESGSTSEVTQRTAPVTDVTERRGR
jgi:hypothetical protein